MMIRLKALSEQVLVETGATSGNGLARGKSVHRHGFDRCRKYVSYTTIAGLADGWQPSRVANSDRTLNIVGDSLHNTNTNGGSRQAEIKLSRVGKSGELLRGAGNRSSHGCGY